MTVSDWVRHLIHEGTRQTESGDAARKLEIIKKASEYSFPTGDIDTMLAEIAQGYSAEEH